MLGPVFQNGPLVNEQLCSTSALKGTWDLVGGDHIWILKLHRIPLGHLCQCIVVFFFKGIHHSFWISQNLHLRLLHARQKASFFCGQNS